MGKATEKWNDAAGMLVVDPVLAAAIPGLLGPLRAIRCLPDWIRDDLRGADPALCRSVEMSLNSILAQTGRIETALEALSGYIGLAAHRPAPMPIAPPERLVAVARKVQPGLALTVNPDCPGLLADPDLFDGAFRALIAHAAARQIGSNPPLQIIGRAGGDGIRLVLRDAGPPPGGPRPLEPDRPGWEELGLVYAARALHLMGGSAEVATGPQGRGGEIRVRLPHQPPVWGAAPPLPS